MNSILDRLPCFKFSEALGTGITGITGITLHTGASAVMSHLDAVWSQLISNCMISIQFKEVEQKEIVASTILVSILKIRPIDVKSCGIPDDLSKSPRGVQQAASSTIATKVPKIAGPFLVSIII